MESIKINKADAITKLTAFIAAVAALKEEAKAANKDVILKEVEYQVSAVDGFTTAAKTKKITVKTADHLDYNVTQAKQILNLYNLSVDDVLELDEYEAKTLASLLNQEVALQDVEAYFQGSVRRA